MTVEELFEEFRNCYSVTFNCSEQNYNEDSINVTYYEAEDRCGDEEEVPMVDVGDYCTLEPADIEEIEEIGYHVKVQVKNQTTPYYFRFLYVKNFSYTEDTITV